MFQKVKNYFKSLRMSNQIILINFSIIAFTILIIFTTYQVQSAIFFNFIEKFSQTLSQKQEKQLVQLNSKQLRQYIQYKNSQTLLNLQHSSDFFQYVSQSRNRYRVIQSQFQECVDQDQINEYIVVYNSDGICQGFETVKSDQEGQQFNDTLTLISPFTQLFIINDDSKILYFDIPKAQYFGGFPKTIKFKNLNLQTRPWYTNHMTQSKIYPNSSYFYSPILHSARDNVPYSALTYSLVRNDSMIGIALQLLPIPDENIQNIPLNILLVHQNGDVILSTMDTFHQLTELVRITNTSYTGFNETDWQTIQNNSKSNQNRDVTFYLTNKLYQRSVFVYSYLFYKENLTMIVFKNVTYEQEISDQIELLIDNLETDLIKQLLIQIGCCAFILFITVNLIKFISAPLLQLIKVINQHIRKVGNNLNSEIFKMAFKTKTLTNSNLFSSLVYQFIALKDIQTKNSQRKSNLCQQMESFQYNFQIQETNTNNIKELLQFLPQYEQQIQNLPFIYLNSKKLTNYKNSNLEQHKLCQNEEDAIKDEIDKNLQVGERLLLINHLLQKNSLQINRS